MSDSSASRPVPTTLSLISVFLSLALLAAGAWVRGPGENQFNAFNERVFGRYFTAGAILMLGAYSAIFLAVAGAAIATAALGWFRNARPAWLRWMAMLLALGTPLALLKLLRSG